MRIIVMAVNRRGEDGCCTALRKELELIQERNREENAQLKKEIEALKRDLESLQAFIEDVPPFTINVRQYDLLKRNSDAHTSRSFYSHPRGYKMCIKIWPNGVHDGQNSHVSVACHVMCGEQDADLKWPFCGNVHLRLVNQKSSNHHLDHFIRYTHRTPRYLSGRQQERRCGSTTHAGTETSQGNYITQFVAHSDLNNSAAAQCYLLNDTLQFIVTKVEIR